MTPGQRPQSPALPASLAVAVLVAGLAAPAWAQQSLEQALANTYVSNPTLSAARAELRSVNEQIPQELSNWRPRVTISGDIGRQEIDNKGATDPQTTTPRSVNLDVTQTLFRGGRTIAGTRRAEADVMAQRQRLKDTEQQVLLGAVTSYMDVWRDQSVLRLNINNEQVLARQLEAARDRFEVGEITRTDVAQSEARLSRATGDRVASEGDLEINRAIYQQIVGEVPGTLKAPPPVGGLPVSQEATISAAEQANPRVLAATFAETSEQNNVKVQFGQLLPEVSLVGSISQSKETSSASSDTERAQVLAQVTVPIYQQGFVSSQVREAKQRSSQRRLQIDEERRRAIQDAISAWKAYVTAQAQIEAFQSQVRATEIALEGVRQENAVGARTILDILDAEQESLDAQVNLVRAQRDDVVASYQIFTAMGRMTAETLGLKVDIYDPEIDLEAVRDVWFGFGDIPYD